MFRVKVLCVVLLAVVMLSLTWRASVARAVPPGVDLGKQFTLFIYETPEEIALRTDAGEKGALYWKSWGEFRAQLEQAGVLRGGMPLQVADQSTQIRLRDGKVVTTPGMIGAASPQISGYFIIEVPSADVAKAWAAKVPNAGSSVVVVSPAFPMAMPAK